MTSISRRVTVSVRMALAGLIVLCMASGIRLRAQTVTGTILGIVLDTSGAVVPNAQITVTNQDTGVVRAAASSADGLYNIPSLEAGNYTVDAKALGFNPVQVRNVVVTVGSSSRIDLRLQVGSTTQSVTVTEAVPTVETTSSEVSQVMNEDFIKEIPLNARDLQQLAVIQPGVQWMNTGFGGTAMTVAGDRPTNNRFLQEGMDMTWTYRLSPISLASNVLLGVEATKEFKVITTNYTADYGEQSGGVISTIFKSGTNTLHGSAYEYYRNSVFDARNFFDQGSAPPFHRNQFGASVGGPIRKDKTFFFVNYEGFRSSLSQSFVANLPDNNARNGMLPCQSTTAGCGANPKGTLAPVTLSKAISQIFFGGNNPLLPVCNGAELTGGFCQWFSSPVQTIRENYAAAKIDHSFSSKNSVSSSYNLDQSTEYSPNQTGATADDQAFRRQTFTLQDTHIVSTNVVNTARLGVNRISYNNEQDIVGGVDRVSPLLIGIPLQVKCASVCTAPSANYPSGVTTPLPGITVPGMQTFGSAIQAAFNYAPRWIGYTAGMISDDINYLHGKHAFQFGFGYKKWDDNIYNYAANSRGPYTFQNLQQFLAGGPASSWSAYVPGHVQNARGFRLYALSFYGEDTYKFRPNLTLTLGLRWEYVPPPGEQSGRLANLNDPNPQASLAPVTGSLFASTSRDNFAPRAGFNWDPFGKGKTSIRGGFGIFFNEIEENGYFGSGTTGQAPFTTSLTLTNQMTIPYQQSLVNTALAAFDASGNFGNFGSAFPAHPKTPTKYGYNLAIQQELPDHISFTIGYVGSTSRHNGRSINYDEYYPTAVETPGQLPMLNGVPIPGAVINPHCTAPGQIQCLYWAGAGLVNANWLGSNVGVNGATASTVPYASLCTATVNKSCVNNNNFGTSITGIAFDANSSYNALEVALERRMSPGLYARFNYTFAKCMEESADDLPSSETNGGGANWSPNYTAAANRSRCAFGGTNSANLSLNYDFPFRNMVTSKFARSLVGGWQLTSQTTVASGIPFDVRAGTNIARASTGTSSGNDHPDWAPGCNPQTAINPHNPTNYVNTACFVPAPAGYLGDVGPLILTSPAEWYTDIGLKKNIPLGESKSILLNADMFNAFNRTNFASPTSTTVFVNSGTSASPAFSPNPAAGQIQGTLGTSRQFQIGAKFTF
jgi:Carboxypeptidase regulatory-like domain/TonB dependent receptor